MKNTIFLISFFCFFFLSQKSSAQQLKVVNVGGTIAHLYEKTVGLETNLVGLTAAVEYPIKTISFRLEGAYVAPTESNVDKLPRIEGLLNLNAYIGKIIGKGKQFQIPAFIGFGKTVTNGDLELNNYNVAARMGVRYYVTQKIALFSDASLHYAFANNVSYVNDLAMSMI